MHAQISNLLHDLFRANWWVRQGETLFEVDMLCLLDLRNAQFGWWWVGIWTGMCLTIEPQAALSIAKWMSSSKWVWGGASISRLPSMLRADWTAGANHQIKLMACWKCRSIPKAFTQDPLSILRSTISRLKICALESTNRPLLSFPSSHCKADFHYYPKLEDKGLCAYSSLIDVTDTVIQPNSITGCLVMLLSPIPTTIVGLPVTVHVRKFCSILEYSVL